jgi:hypothetical protein
MAAVEVLELLLVNQELLELLGLLELLHIPVLH